MVVVVVVPAVLADQTVYALLCDLETRNFRCLVHCLAWVIRVRRMQDFGLEKEAVFCFLVGVVHVDVLPRRRSSSVARPTVLRSTQKRGGRG